MRPEDVSQHLIAWHSRQSKDAPVRPRDLTVAAGLEKSGASDPGTLQLRPPRDATMESKRRNGVHMATLDRRSDGGTWIASELWRGALCPARVESEWPGSPTE
ncbi:hypothetical protein Dac01nite_05040 [Demequina activiva]|uniref:Uncharacterized protein n=1 Tax=Demequina activiva TaxID=1582364 RepID=A0A919Q0B6_9MICO|nr:hypothetical protein Dac01nite_05040 [Demequina activiva]